jgi:hypothetical protein
VTNESRVPATSPASRVHSVMDALCLVGGVHHVVLRELSHDLTGKCSPSLSLGPPSCP